MEPTTPPAPVGTLEEQQANGYQFTSDWFTWVKTDFEDFARSASGKELRVLEIGAYEGRSTMWMLDHLCEHPQSRLTVVDNFVGGMEHEDTNDCVIPGLEQRLEHRFLSNVARCKHVGQLRVIKKDADEALLQLRHEKAIFDFIYVDGSHVAIDVLHDAVQCWRMLAVGGTIVFDDYRWKGYSEDYYNPRIAIQSFLLCAEPEIETKTTESQMWVTKVLNRSPPTANEDKSLWYWKPFELRPDHSRENTKGPEDPNH
ncbi:hypothetical protein MMC10_011422 [Thelotrema lepadinum]|nr:hypothetical protein [Thelotrema lepadinum]